MVVGVFLCVEIYFGFLRFNFVRLEICFDWVVENNIVCFVLGRCLISVLIVDWNFMFMILFVLLRISIWRLLMLKLVV